MLTILFLILLLKKDASSERFQTIFRLTTIMTNVISQMAGKFSEKLNLMVKIRDGSNKDVINKLITDVYFEVRRTEDFDIFVFNCLF